MSFSGAIEAGKAFVAFGVNTKGFDRGLRRMQGRMKAFGASMQVASASIATSMAFSVLPIIGAIKVFADLEEQMTFVAAAAGKNLDEITGVTSAIRELGRTTSFTSKEISDGALALARAGVSAGSIPTTLKAVVAFSKATQLEMGRAGEVVVDTLNAFGLPFSRATEVVDILTKTANASSQTMEQLAEAMSYAAPQAAGLGISLKNTAAALAILANQGIKASIAGTGLQRILINMGKSIQQAKFKDLGIETVDKTTGSMRDLSAIMIDLNEYAARMNFSKGEKLALLNDLFGRGSKAALAMARTLGVSQEAYENYLDKIDAGKTAQAIQAQLMSTTAGQLQLIRSAFLDAADAIGSSFKGAIAAVTTPILRLNKNIAYLWRNNQELGNTVTKTMLGILAFAGAMFVWGTTVRLLAFTLMPALRAALLLWTAAFKLVSLSIWVVETAMAAFTAVMATSQVTGGILSAMVVLLSAEYTAFAAAVWVCNAAIFAWNVAVGAALLLGSTPIMAIIIASLLSAVVVVGTVIIAFKAWGKMVQVVSSELSRLGVTWGKFFGNIFTSGKNIVVSFRTGDIQTIFEVIWNELRFTLSSFLTSLAKTLHVISEATGDTVTRASRRATDILNAGANRRGEQRSIEIDRFETNKKAKEESRSAKRRRDAERFENDTTEEERDALTADTDSVDATLEALANFKPTDQLTSSEKKARDREEKALARDRERLAKTQTRINDRIEKDAAEIAADSGTGSDEDLTKVKEDRVRAGLDLDALELRRKKNQLAIDKRAAGNVDSFQKNLTAPSSTDIQGASGFNKLLIAANNPVISTLESIAFKIEEEGLKTQTLLQEQKQIAQDIKEQNEEITDLDDQLTI